MARCFFPLLGIVVVLSLIAGPVGYALQEQRQMKHFRVVRDGVLYRSGQMTPAGLQRVLHDYLIRTVITLRDKRAPEQTPPDQAEEIYCRELGLNYVRIPPRSWDARDGVAPVDEGVRTFKEVLRDPGNHPVLIHCFNGIHRTGAYCAIYRMEFERWTHAQAIAEMKACGYNTLAEERDILGYLENYVPGWR